ncbi:MAG: multiheme c-type cytochrome [Xanthomonadales bacterium]|jgi:DmsE family decaheme c-type cytochrome|nr:multiheme c-type cytochrome [Xanthomonadales bacterium]MDH3926254.1 multiheme c-type cytochrome [Xanthomonadales bacterium]MDH3941259.1 multiheme c-type cytochrome [Xanthomonadales bacterium]MDH4000667.1 multiheme c-type cytochrome [Xanthomonadales bacterium]
MKPFIFIIPGFLLLCSWPEIAAAETAPAKYSRTPSYTADGSEACLRCHSGEKMRSIATSAHGDPQRPGSPAAEQGCESCHGPGSIHVSRAHGGRGFPPLTQFGRGKDAAPREEQLHACLSCHADERMEDQRITFIGSAHDRQTINCSTCHTAHAGGDPISDRESQLATCSRCHRRHLEEHPRFEDKSIDFDALSCSTCHDVHVPAALEE